MNKIWGVSALALATAGCAYVPELESEDTFSYAEIVSQIQCETYLAALLVYENSAFGGLDFDSWVVKIEISPNNQVDGQFNLGGSYKPVTKNPNFFQAALGGTGAASGLGLESYGSARVTNDYVFTVASLYAPKLKGGKVVLDKGSPVAASPKDPNFHELNPSLANICTGTPHGLPRQNAVPNVLNGDGFFGIYPYLDRSFIAQIVQGPKDATGGIRFRTVNVTGMSYTKQYRTKISLGATPGWYVSTGNISPAVGAYRLIDNTIALTFSAPAAVAKPKPIKVVIVEDRTKGGLPSISPQKPPANAGAPAAPGSKMIAPPSPESVQKLQNDSSNVILRGLQQKLDQLQ